LGFWIAGTTVWAPILRIHREPLQKKHCPSAVGR